MDRQQILDAIQNLSRCQGFYSGLYNTLISGSDEAEEALDMLESQNFGDVVDMVLFIEG